MSAFDELTEKQPNPFDEAASKAEEPSESSTEKDETPSGQEGTEVEEVPEDLNKDSRPLHKDERFKSLIAERNRLREEREQWLEEKAKFYEERATVTTKSTEVQSKPSWFQKYFGDDEEAWQGFQGMNAKAKAEAKQEALEELRQESRQQEEQQKYWQTWVQDKLNELKETEGDFNENELTDVMRRFKPTDEQGNLDFRAGLNILRLEKGTQEKLKGVAKKKVAATLGTDKGKTEPQDDDVITPEKLKKMGGWDFTQSN